MPNWCNVKMRVIGKKYYVNQLINIIRPDYEQNGYTLSRAYIPYIPTISYLTVLREDIIDIYKDMVCVDMELACAWSIYSGMLYNNTDPIQYPFATNLLDVSRFFKLYIELYGNETSMLFSEHYIIKDGEIYVDDEGQILTFNIAEINYETFIKENPLMEPFTNKMDYNKARNSTGVLYVIPSQQKFIINNKLKPMIEIKKK